MCVTSWKGILFSSPWGIFLDFSDHKNLGSRLFNYCSLAANCRSLTPLGLRITCLIAFFFFTSGSLRKKHFRSNFLISCTCVASVPTMLVVIKSDSCSTSPCSKVPRKEISRRWMKFLPNHCLVKDGDLYDLFWEVWLKSTRFKFVCLVGYTDRIALELNIDDILSLMSISFLIIGVGDGLIIFKYWFKETNKSSS